jgi:ATP-dependent DNA ligase
MPVRPDGEIIVQDKNGLSDFAALRAAIESSPHRLVMFAFDLLWLDGEDLRRLPLMERRDKLQRLLPKDQRCAIQYSEHWDGSGAALFKKACDMGLEGIVSKRALSAYKGGPSKFWLGRARDFEARAAWPMMHISRGSRPCSILTSPAVLAGFSISFGIYLMNEGPGGSSRNTH